MPAVSDTFASAVTTPHLQAPLFTLNTFTVFWRLFQQ
jgi:hypothetical protein